MDSVGGGCLSAKAGETSLDFVVMFCQGTAIDPDVDTARQPDTSGQDFKRRGRADWLRTLHPCAPQVLESGAL